MLVIFGAALARLGKNSTPEGTLSVILNELYFMTIIIIGTSAGLVYW